MIIYVKYIMNIMSIINHEIILQVSGSSRDVTVCRYYGRFSGEVVDSKHSFGEKNGAKL